MQKTKEKQLKYLLNKRMIDKNKRLKLKHYFKPTYQMEDHYDLPPIVTNKRTDIDKNY